MAVSVPILSLMGEDLSLPGEATAWGAATKY